MQLFTSGRLTGVWQRVVLTSKSRIPSFTDGNWDEVRSCAPDSEFAPHLRRCAYNQGFESFLIISTIGSYLVAAFVACLTLWITVWHPPVTEHCHDYGTLVRLQSGGFMHTVFHRSVAELWVKGPSLWQWLTFICDCLTLPSERTPVCNHYRLHVTKFKLLSTNTAQVIATQCFSNNINFDFHAKNLKKFILYRAVCVFGETIPGWNCKGKILPL